MSDEPYLSPEDRIERELLRDLRKDVPAGQQPGSDIPQSEDLGLSAEALKDLHSRLPGLTDAELKSVPIEPVGYLLREGATYVDLRDPDLKPFVATGGMRTQPGQALAPKSATDYLVWNRIVGVAAPEQLDLPPDTKLP